MRSFLSTLFALGASCSVYAQFAPQAGISGSAAIHKTDASIKSWASHCTVSLGYQDIADPSLGYPVLGTGSDATGAADGMVVCLGDSGVAVLNFSSPIYNGSGPDFAVFENGFANPADKEQAFLELAFVEVSSDGERFFRFPAVSNTPLTEQVKGVGEYMNARLLDNLAGKYIAQYGTPFDLEDLKDSSGLDIDNITHVRIIDVIGDIGSHSSRDRYGNIINDPYPTPFPTGGFDLDAVGVIHQKAAGLTGAAATAAVSVYPNPASDFLHIDWQDRLPAGTCTLSLSDLSGRNLIRVALEPGMTIPLSKLQTGLYYLSISNSTGTIWSGKISKI